MEKAVNRLLIIFLLGTIAFGTLMYKYRNADHDSLFEEAYTFELCEYIEIDVSRMSVTLVPYDEPDITVAYKNDKPLDFETGDNSLFITESSQLLVSLFTGDKSDFSLYLYLPRQSYREISVYTGLGNVMAGRIDSQMLTINTESGNIICDDSISRLNLSTISGKIDVDYELIADGTEINSRRGNVDFNVHPKSEFSVDFNTKTGTCECDFSDGEFMGTYKYTFNGGGNTINAYIEEGVLSIREK